jgi:hypothetical protein
MDRKGISLFSLASTEIETNEISIYQIQGDRDEHYVYIKKIGCAEKCTDVQIHTCDLRGGWCGMCISCLYSSEKFQNKTCFPLVQLRIGINTGRDIVLIGHVNYNVHIFDHIKSGIPLEKYESEKKENKLKCYFTITFDMYDDDDDSFKTTKIQTDKKYIGKNNIISYIMSFFYDNRIQEILKVLDVDKM